jgi:transcription elongation factor Elf1
VVLFLHEQGYVSLEEVFTDGTKIESVANRYTFIWKKTTERNKSNLEKKIQTVLNEIDKAISQDNDILTDDFEKQDVKPISSEELHEKIEQINKKLRSRKDSHSLKKKVDKLQREALPKLLEYEEHLNILGERNSYSKTDRDATFMRMKEDHMQNGQLKPAYNAQISTENNFITNFSLHQNPGDTTTFQDHLNSFDTRYNRYPVRSIADAGYGSLENYDFLEEKQIEPFVKYSYFHKEQTKKFQSDIRHIENLYYNELEDYFVCPIGQKMRLVRKETKKSSQGYPYEVHIYQATNCSNCTLRGACHKQEGNREIDVNKRLIRHKQKVRENLTSEQGIELRKRRCPEVEQTFGQLKSNKGFKRFLLRGLPKVTVELGLLSISHNMQKMCALIIGNGRSFVFDVFFGFKNAFIAFLKQVKTKIHPTGIPTHSNQKITIEFTIFKEAA